MNARQPSIECRSPRADELIRVRPGPERNFATAALRDRDTGVLYLVVGRLWPMLGNRAEWVCPRACINDRGEVFIWPMPFPPPNGQPDSWLQSARAVADLAELRWIAVTIDNTKQQYRIGALGRDREPGEPIWPEVEFIDLVMEAFRGHGIVDEDHPLIRMGGKS